MEYPKALYLGDNINHELAIVDDSLEEDELREKGYVDFYDLPETVAEETLSGIKISSDQDLESAKNKIAQLEEELADFKGTHIAFLNDVPAMKARIAELEAGKEGSDQDEQNSESHDYTSMTSDQIRAILDEKGIKWLKRDDKDTLISYLTKE